MLLYYALLKKIPNIKKKKGSSVVSLKPTLRNFYCTSWDTEKILFKLKCQEELARPFGERMFPIEQSASVHAIRQIWAQDVWGQTKEHLAGEMWIRNRV